jgi:hypothetical protein
LTCEYKIFARPQYHDPTYLFSYGQNKMSDRIITTFRLNPKTKQAIKDLKSLNVKDIYGKNKYKSLSRIIIHICLYTEKTSKHIRATHIQEIHADRTKHGIEKDWLIAFTTYCNFLGRARDIVLNNAIIDIWNMEKYNEKLRLFKLHDELSKLEK